MKAWEIYLGLGLLLLIAGGFYAAVYMTNAAIVLGGVIAAIGLGFIGVAIVYVLAGWTEKLEALIEKLTK